MPTGALWQQQKGDGMSKGSITVHHAQGVLRLSCETGTPLAPLLRDAGLLALPCGRGQCGKCLIYADTPPTPEERALLGPARLDRGLRLACHTLTRDGLEVTVPHEGELRVLTSFAGTTYDREPLVRRQPLAVPPGTLEDQRDDVRRLLAAAGADRHCLTLEQLVGLPALLRSGQPLDGLLQDGCLIGVRPQDHSLALIVDIGTTTVAALLLDVDEGRILSSLGEQNAQAPYGADVISRIQQEMAWEAGGGRGDNPLQAAICRQINAMLARLLAEAGREDVDFLSLTGNTTMLHLLCGLPGEHISRAPFIPVTLEAMRLPARRLGIDSQAECFLLPSISAYIGADIVASLLAADAHHPQPPFLLIDLGTNAETVLCAGGELLACSAAAGPCFEGATLSCGMAGQDGAIDSVTAHATEGLAVTTIGHVPARGLCGSGVLDALALLLDTGLVDETGHLEADDSPLGRRVRGNALHLAEGVFLTQRDIREVQLAKAAVRAGVEILLREANLSRQDIQCLYLAGGFGSAMRPRSAVRIGLVPREWEERVRVLGNAASFGALRYVTEKDAPRAARDLIRRTRYIELSAHSGFADAYVEHMIFPLS